MRKLLQLLFLSPIICFGQSPFINVTEKAGINHEFEVYQGMFGGGAIAFDYDNDGYEDLYITSGKGTDRLYKNLGNGTFKDVFEGSGLELTKNFITQGVASADINKDGFRDLLVTTITTKNTVQVIPRAINLLFLNKGNGTFKEVTKEFGLGELNSFSTGVSFGDINKDGYPDIYIGNYFNDFKGTLTEVTDATIVGANQISEGYLLLNKGGKYFEDVYKDYDLSYKGFGFGAAFTDYDNDGDPDIYVIHDFGYKRTPNIFLDNQYPKKKYIDVAPKLKMDLKINAMSCVPNDFNNDGKLDYFISNIKFNHLMQNNGKGKPFNNIAKREGLVYYNISWGANFADFDHDGYEDLFVANGDLNPNCVPMNNLYFKNTKGKFSEISTKIGVNNYGIGRGSITFDMDNDGDLDLLVVNQKATKQYPVESKTVLYENTIEASNWVKVKLEGIQSDKNGLGAHINIVAGTLKMLREIDGGSSSHLSQNSSIAHFGLNSNKLIDSVIVTWPAGGQQVLLNIAANQTIIITEEPFKNSYNLWYLLLFPFVVFCYFLLRKYLI